MPYLIMRCVVNALGRGLLRLHAEEGGDVSPNAFRRERERMDREIGR